MVQFRANQEHFSKSMHVMNDFRKNGTFCDISLIVGDEVLKAHRCVLAAGSSYFNVLFLGQFAEASMNEIDLCEVTKDIGTLEMMVDCLYTGEIDINAGNLDTVVKLSSYFIMETVIEFCQQFMVDTLSLQTCLNYYQCAMEGGLADIAARTTRIVKMRLHDSIILQQEILDVSPKELMNLHKNDVFQFCTPQDILKYLVSWVKNGLTAELISVGTEILDSVGCVKDHASLPLMHSTEDILRAAHEEMIPTISKARLVGHENFIHLVLKLCNQLIGNRDSKMISNQRNLPMENIPSTSIDVDKENVLVTWSPRQCVFDHFNVEFIEREHTRPYTEAVFDVCAYVPSMRCWYYLKPIDDQVLSTLDLGTLLDEDSRDDWVFTMRSDQLVFAYMKDPVEALPGTVLNNMALHSLNSNAYEESAFGDQVKQQLQNNESWEQNQFCIVSGSDNSLYMITVISCHIVEMDGSEYDNILFRCFKFHDGDQRWQVLFQTEEYTFEDYEFLGPQIRELHASISTVSNELLVTFCDKEGECRNIVFIVNLGLENPVPVSIWNSAELDEFDAVFDKRVSIVQGKEQFFILFDIMVPEDDDVPELENYQHFIKVKFEVRYHSNRLTTVETDQLELGEIEVIQPKDGHSDDNCIRKSMPCLKERNISEGESTWYICGNKGFESKLTEVTVNHNRTPVIKAHPPPPFTCITAAFAGTVSKDVLNKFKPVSFLGE